MTTAAETEFASVGDTIPVDCVTGECLGELEVEEILLGGNCKVSDDTFGPAPIPEGKVLVQVSGVQKMVKEPEKAGVDSSMSLMYPGVWSADDVKEMAESLTWCTNPDGYELWGSSSGMGEKMRVYGTFLVPEGSKVLGIERSKFDLAKLKPAEEESVTSGSTTASAESESAVVPEAEGVESPVAPAPADGAAGQVEAPAEESALLDYPVEPTGTQSLESMILYCDESAENTVFTDGSTGFTAECAVALNG